jgi:iron complex transport system ATP-binding protein
MLTVVDLDFSYHGRRVLRGVSLEVGSGQMVGLVGPNGAGKSTLVRLVSRVLEPARGRILLDGRELRTFSRGELARRVAVVPQAPLLPPAYPAIELVLLGRTPHLRLLQREGERDRRIALEAMSATGTAALASRRISELSGGERQRVVIARALAQEPQLLLLDEPTTHLDLGHQVGVLELVRELNARRGLSVLAVFHDLTLAAQFCGRIVLLAEGEVRGCGTPEEVLQSRGLSEAYGIPVEVVPHPTTGLPIVVPRLNRGAPAGERG